VKSPIVEVEIGGEVMKTSVLKNIQKNPNFEDNRILHFDVVSYYTYTLFVQCQIYLGKTVAQLQIIIKKDFHVSINIFLFDQLRRCC
jgi:hypothetical protein